MNEPTPEIDPFGNLLLDAKRCLDEGRNDEAARLCRSMPSSHPLWARSLQMLILALRRDARFAETLEPCRAWQRLEPGNGKAWLMEGLCHEKLGNTDNAIECLRAAIERSPGTLNTITILASLLWQHDMFEECAAVLNAGVEQFPNNPSLLASLARALAKTSEFRDAVDAYLHALELAPQSPELHRDLGKLYLQCHSYGQAIQYFLRSIDLEPSVAAYCGQALALRQQARHLEIEGVTLKALELDPMSRNANNIRLYSLNHRGDLSAANVANVHRAWGDKLVARNKQWCVPHRLGQRRTNKQLRIGYVSCVFSHHVTAYFLMPLLEAHDRQRFEISLYADAKVKSTATYEYKELADNWREIQEMDDLEVAELIRSDEIDILIDIQGPSEDRDYLNLLAMKPAPVQVSWLGYPATSGVSTVDYRFADIVTDPAGHDAYFTEELVRLPDGFLCYQPPEDAGEVTPPPCLANGYVTFGVFNSATKINALTCWLWARILDATPGSRLIVKGRSFVDEATTVWFRRMFDHAGIPSDRLEIIPFQLRGDDHYAAYDRADVALDSFPYTGTTTTCETLWRGVPVVTLLGDRHVQRVSASILTRVGLERLIATDTDDFVAKAVALAGDIEHLTELRRGMQGRMLKSPLTDKAHYAGQIETAFETMWRTWLNSQAS